MSSKRGRHADRPSCAHVRICCHLVKSETAKVTVLTAIVSTMVSKLMPLLLRVLICL